MKIDMITKIEKERKEKDVFFKVHSQSPIPPEEKNNFTSLNYYPVKPEFRFVIDIHEHKDKDEVEVNDNKGNRQEFLRWGEFKFELNDKQVTLQAYKSDLREERLWVPFRDMTNEKETYGAGRYIDLDAYQDKKDDKWILDFNRAYNPFCAYSESYVCPFIPPENWLELEVKAGEKKYRIK